MDSKLIKKDFGYLDFFLKIFKIFDFVTNFSKTWLDLFLIEIVLFVYRQNVF